MTDQPDSTLDEGASTSQTEALGAIFSGAAGGHPAVLAGHIGEVMGVAPARITFDADASTLRFTVGTVADVKLAAIEGQGDAQVTIANHPLAIAPGNPAVTARSEYFTYRDHGYEWELSGKNGFISPFRYEG